MRKNLSITTLAATVLLTSGVAMTACFADSEAALQASSYSESNNNSEQSRQNTSAATTQNETDSHRQNNTQSSVEAGAPVSTSADNLSKTPEKPKATPTTWGAGPSWGTPAAPKQEEKKVTAKTGAAVTPVATAKPKMKVVSYRHSGSRLASRTSYSRTTVRQGRSANGRYTYIKKQIRSATVPM